MDGRDHSHGELIAFRHSVVKALADEPVMNMTVDAASNWVLERTPTHFQVSTFVYDALYLCLTAIPKRMIAANYSYGIERDEAKLRANNLDNRKWTNPLEVQCVSAPPGSIAVLSYF